jgi:hypothetical protein
MLEVKDLKVTVFQSLLQAGCVSDFQFDGFLPDLEGLRLTLLFLLVSTSTDL